MIIVFIIIFLIFNLLFSSIFPLSTYALSLALFGLLHVTQELHYIKKRFFLNYQLSLIKIIILLLLSIILIRFIHINHIFYLYKQTFYLIELSIVWLMIAMVYFTFKNIRSSLILSLILCILGYGIYNYPLILMVIFSIFHNFTPIFFLMEYKKNSYERLNQHQQREFKWIYYASLFSFILMPLLIIFIQPLRFFPDLSREAFLLNIGHIDQHLSVFTLKHWWGAKPYDLGVSIFSAVVFCQVMHYTLVIHILPRCQGWLEEQNDEMQVSTIQGFFKENIPFIAISMLSFYLFYLSFYQARQYYSLIASFHAWIELPLLLSTFLVYQYPQNQQDKIK